MRLSATTSLMERRDVIVVATVSCIYGLGNPEDYREMRIELKKGDTVDMREIMRRLVGLQYERNDAVFERSRFRVRGDVLEILPSYAQVAVRVEFFGDEIERIRRIDPLTGERGGGAGLPHHLPGQVLRHAAGAPAQGAPAHPRGAGHAVQAVLRRGQAPGGGADQDTHRVRPGDAGGDGLLLGHRELLPPPERPQGRGEARGAPGLLPAEVPHVHRRVPRHAAPGARHVRGGPRPQALPGASTDSACPRPWTTGPSSTTSSRACWTGSSSSPPRPGEEEAAKSRQLAEQVIRPTGLLDPVLEVRPTEGQMEDLYAEIQGADGAEGADAGHHAHQADGGGPDRLPRRAGAEGALPALGDRDHRARGDPAGPARWGPSTSWSASTSCARAWTCRRSR